MGKNDVSKIVLKGNVDEYVTISDKKNVTLDLNGFILTNETDSTSAAKGVIVNNGILTIQDSSKDGNGTVNAMNRKVAVANAGTLTFESGNFKNTATTESKPYANYILNNNGKVVINGGIFQVDSKTQTNSSVIKNGWYDPTNTGVHANDVIAYQEGKIAEMTINNGSFSSWTYVKNDTYGKMTINNGSFNVLKKDNGSSGNCVYNGGDLTVKGGTFDNSNAAKAGALFLIGSGIKNSGTVTNIDGGVFNLNAKYSGQESPSAPLILISGESGVPGGIDINIDTDAVKNLGDHPLALTALFVNKDSSGNITERYDKVGEFQLTVGGCSIADSNFGDIKTKGDNGATADYKPSFTYSNGKLVVDTISMGTGNSYVSGNVKIESLIVADNGTVVLGSGSEAKLADDSAKTKIVSTGGVLKDTTGKTIEAEKKTVDNITTVEDLNKALAIGADVENVNVTLKDKEEIKVSGSTLSGTIKFGSDSVNFNGVKGDFTVFGGNSVDVEGNITGGTIEVTAGDVEIISGKIIADTIIEAGSGATVKFSDVTVNSGVKLTLKGAGTFEVKAGKAFNLYGSIDAQGVAAGSTLDIDVKKTADATATFKAYSGSQISGKILVKGDGNIDLTQAQNPQTVGEDISYDKTYGQLENVTVVGSLTIKNNSTVIVKGGFQVNEGVTVTIEKGSKLVIDSLAASMIVDGRIVVEEGATLEVKNAKDVKVSGSIDSDGTVIINSKVTIKSGGAITINDGTVAKPTADVTTVDKVKELYGSVFEPTKGLIVEAGATLTVKSLMYSDAAMNIDNKGTVVFDKAIIGGANVTVNMLADGAVVQVLSIENIATNVDATGKATVWQSHSLIIKDLGLVFADKTKVETGKENTVTITPQGYAFKGLTVVEKVTSYTGDDGKKQYNNNLDLAGTVSVSKIEEVSATPSPYSLTFSVSGERIAVSGELTLGKSVVLAVNGKLSVTGKLVATEDGSEIANSGEITVTGLVQALSSKKIADVINAAMYESKIGTTIVYNYTTLKAAIDSGAKDITVSGKIYVTESVTVPAGVTIKNNGEIVVGSADDTEVVLTVADTASIKYGKVTVDGTLYFENKKDNKAAEIVSDVSVIGEKDARYTNLFTALNNANAGEIVTVDKTTVDLKKSITIKDGVTLDVPNSKALKVYAGVTITVNGILKTAEKIETATFTKTDGTEAQVTFALAADKLNGKAAIIVNGVFMSGVEFSYNGAAPAYMIPGAYYSLTDDAGAYNYVTTLENASKTAATSVTVYGKVSAGDVVFTGTDSEPKVVTVAGNAELTVSSITLDKTAFTVNATGKFTGDVKAGDAAVSVKLVKDMAVSVDKDGLFTVERVSNVDKTSSFKVSAGSVYIKVASMDVTVAAGATLVSAATTEGTTITGKLIIEGTVSVANQQTITVNGNVIVKGVLSVADATDSKTIGIFNANENLYIGVAVSDVYKAPTGDAASVSGEVSVAMAAFVKADANVSDATIESFKVDGVLKSTTYVVEGKDWMTVYDRTGNYYIGKVTEAPFENAEFKANKWLSTDGESADKKVIGASKCDKVTANIEYKIYTIQITPCAGVESIAIDGNLISNYYSDYYNSLPVKAGSHIVTYSLANGYSGEAKLSIAKVDKTTASVSGQSFTVSGDEGKVYLQLTGVEKSGYVDPTPVVPEEKDDGMSLTDILLIVLVVLIVIMAVIVAMRLMRS